MQNMEQLNRGKYTLVFSIVHPASAGLLLAKGCQQSLLLLPLLPSGSLSECASTSVIA